MEKTRQQSALIVLALVVVAGLIGLVWRLGPGGKKAARPPTAPTRSEAPPAGTSAGTPSDREQPTLDMTDPDEADPVEAPTPRPGEPALAELLAAVPGELVAIATPCYTGEYRPDNAAQYVSFRYTVAFNDGWARIEDVVLLASDMDDQELRNCVLETVRGSRFQAPEARRHVTRQQTSISIADLSR